MENYGSLQGEKKTYFPTLGSSSPTRGLITSFTDVDTANTGTATGAAAAAADAVAGAANTFFTGSGTATSLAASVCAPTSCSSVPDIKLIDANMSDEKLNQEEHLLIISINSIGCKNYGMNNDIIQKYPYCDIVGHRYSDRELKCIASQENRSSEGSCIVSPAPIYKKGPLIASLVSQYGLGKPFDRNRLSQKIVKRCTQESFRYHLRQDTTDNRCIYFNTALQKLGNALVLNMYPDIDKVIFPIGIGCRSVDDIWLCRYYEIIKKFSREIKSSGIRCYIAVRKPYLYAIEKFVNKRCSDKAKFNFRELKSLAWKDVDEKWFNELINKKEVSLFENIQRSNSQRLDVLEEGEDVVDNSLNKDHDYVADLLNKTIDYDDYKSYLEC